ncbi:MAG: hypothetical protein WC809_00190 [Sinimarinibacterium sp.]|jgi:hypothetical protein
MKILKTLLVLLLAWTFSVQAIAGASGINCRMGGKRLAAAALSAEHAATPTATDAHAMHGAMHGDHLKPADGGSTQKQETVLASDGCDCGCHCVTQHCTSSASGLAASPVAGVARFFADSLRPARGQASPASAYARDLIRPPSIT